MDLKMFLGNQLIDSIRIDILQFNRPGYITSLQMDMEEQNEDILDLSDEEPKFFIEPVPSSINTVVSFFPLQE